MIVLLLLCQLDAGAMKEDLSQLAELVRTKWPYAKDKGVDPDAIARRLAPRCDAIKTPRDFAALLEEFVAELQDGHAFVSVPDVVTLPPRVLPVRLVDTREGVATSDGRLVTAIDGRPVEDAIRDAKRRVFASTDGARRVLALDRLRHTDAEKVALTIGGERVELATDFPAPDPPPGPPAWRVEDGIGHLRLETFQPDPEAWAKVERVEDREKVLAATKKLLEQAFTELKDAKALVLDLRGNGGGTDLLGSRLAQHLLVGRFTYFRLSGTPWSPPKDDALPRFTGRLVVLIDERCFSVTDNFLACLADLHPDVRFVGRPTHGGTGAPMRLGALKHSRAELTLCTMRVTSPKGRLIEGHGTKPHVEVRRTLDDVAKKRDPDLEAALREARR